MHSKVSLGKQIHLFPNRLVIRRCAPYLFTWIFVSSSMKS